MTKEEKGVAIDALFEKLSKNENFYLTDISQMTVETSNKLRRICFKEGVSLHVVKNTLLKKALERTQKNYGGLYDVLKGSSSIMFCDSPKAPAKLIKQFRKTNPKPILKGGFIYESVFIGDDNLDALISLKTKNEMVGEIIGILQSPAKNVISALQSGGNKLAGIVKTLSER